MLCHVLVVLNNYCLQEEFLGNTPVCFLAESLVRALMLLSSLHSKYKMTASSW